MNITRLEIYTTKLKLHNYKIKNTPKVHFMKRQINNQQNNVFFLK